MGRKLKIKFHSTNEIVSLLFGKKFGIGSTFYKVTIQTGKNFCDYRNHVR